VILLIAKWQKLMKVSTLQFIIQLYKLIYILTPKFQELIITLKKFS